MGEVKLISAGDDIKLWDSTNFSLYKQLNPHDNNISCITWSHDNNLMASTSSKDDKVVLTFVNNPSVTLSEIKLPNKTGALCVDFNSHSRFLLIGRSDHAISIYDCKTNSFKKTYEEHKGPVTSVQFNWNDTNLASGSETGEIILHNIVTAQASSPLLAPNVQAIRQLQYSNYKKSLLASASDDGSINLWDTNTRRLIHSFSGGHRAPATGLVFSPLNGALLCSVGLDKRIQFMDVGLKKPVNTITVESPITSVDMMYDGATLAVGSCRGKVYIYDIRQIIRPIKILSAHQPSVQSLKFKNNPELMDFSKSRKAPEKSSAFSPSLRRQLPPAPAADSLACAKTPESVNYGAKRENTDSGAAVEDIFSPIREGYDSRDSMNRTSRSNETTDSVNETVAGGLFSPLSDNLAVNVSRRYMTDGASFVRSSLAGTVPTSQTFNRGNSYNIPQQAELKMPGMPTRISSTATLEASPMLSQPPHSSSNRSSGLLHVPGSSASLFTGSGGRGISASPSFPTFDSNEEGGEAATGITNGPVHSGNTNSEQKRTAVQPDENYTRSPSGAVGGLHELKSRSYRDRLADRGDHSAGAVQEAQPFQQHLVRHLIEEALEDFREEVHRDMLSLHMEMIRQFQIQLAETRSMMQQYSLNGELIAEIERLKEENKRLKKTF